MTDHDKREDPGVDRINDRARDALIVGAVLVIASGITLAASVADPARVALQGGGYVLAVLAGHTVIAWGALTGHARIMDRQRQQHERVMAELDGIRKLLHPVITDQVAQQRGHHGSG